MPTAVYPGSFDPVTNGHIDIATRAACLFDRLIVGVYAMPLRNLLFSTEERLDMMGKALAHLPNVEVEAYRGLTVDFARSKGAKVIVRGLRAVTDFEYEFEMAITNEKLAPELESVYLMTKLEYLFITASRIREVSELGGNIDNLVPPWVAKALKNKFKDRIESVG